MSAFHRDFPDSFQAALQMAREILSRNHSLIRKGTIEVESELILAHAYREIEKKSLKRLELHSKADHRLSEKVAQRVLILASERADGKLLQHLLEMQVFLDHEYKVTPDVLIPRPETELLVRLAEGWIQNSAAQRGYEVGVGSGVIAIELLSKFPNLEMTGTESSPHAIEVARHNARAILLNETRLEILQVSDPKQVIEPFRAMPSADFLISNPPYLLRGEAELDVELEEPAQALFAPPEDAIYFYRKFATEAASILRPKGALFLELPHERASLIKNLFQPNEWSVRIELDLTQRPRYLLAERS